MTYGLEARAARSRALSGALASGIAAIGPVVLGLVLLVRTGTALDPIVIALVVSALVVLAVVRVVIAYGSARRELEALKITLEPEALAVTTRRKTHRIPRAAITQIVEFPGALGGLRLELAERWDGSERSPELFDVPRGGESFGELRAALERWRPVERPKRRGPIARVIFGALVVVGLFFVPFLVADLGRSPWLAGGIVLLGWFAMRVALHRR